MLNIGLLAKNTDSQTQKELKRFLIVGLIAVGIDLLCYCVLLFFLHSNLAKGISFLLGTVVAYLFNKYWAFEKKKTSYSEMVRFAILYFSTLGLNILTNKLVIDYTAIILLAFFLATGISAVLNFIGQKFWVFK